MLTWVLVLSALPALADFDEEPLLERWAEAAALVSLLLVADFPITSPPFVERSGADFLSVTGVLLLETMGPLLSDAPAWCAPENVAVFLRDDDPKEEDDLESEEARLLPPRAPPFPPCTIV
jgi:hypothetical protein